MTAAQRAPCLIPPLHLLDGGEVAQREPRAVVASLPRARRAGARERLPRDARAIRGGRGQDAMRHGGVGVEVVLGEGRELTAQALHRHGQGDIPGGLARLHFRSPSSSYSKNPLPDFTPSFPPRIILRSIGHGRYFTSPSSSKRCCIHRITSSRPIRSASASGPTGSP